VPGGIVGAVRWLGRSIGVVALLGLGMLVLAPGALAQEEGPDADDQVVLSGNLLVPEGETVNTAVIFSGDALVEGNVSEWLVVFNGRTEITGTIGEGVVVFAGDVVLRSGALVRGDVISIEEPVIEEGATVEGSVDDLPTRWDLYSFGFLGRYAWWLAYTVSTLALGLILLLLVPRLDSASVRALRERVGAAIGFGLLLFLLLPVVAGLLLATVVGIPLGLFLLLALALVYTIAYVIGALALGRVAISEPRSRYVAFLVGWGALRLMALIPFLDGVAWLVATVLGFGTLWVGARAAPKRERPAGAATPVSTT
jgi:hypothetical protein